MGKGILLSEPFLAWRRGPDSFSLEVEVWPLAAFLPSIFVTDEDSDFIFGSLHILLFMSTARIISLPFDLSIQSF